MPKRVVNEITITTKKKINSRQKGQRSERALAKLFSEWWGADFCRTPLSGGWANSHTRGEVNAAGDLVCSDPSFPFTVEAKHVEKWHLEDILKSEKCLFWKWWEQCREETPMGKVPLLVFTKNRDKWYFAAYTQQVENLPMQGETFDLTSGYHIITIGLLENLLTPEVALRLKMTK